MKTKSLYRVLLLVYIFVSSLLATDVQVSVGGEKVIDKLETKKLKYINKIPNDRCLTYIEASNTKKDSYGKPYKFILDDFNYKTGFTKYLVYKVDTFNKINQNKPIDSIEFVNDACAKDVAIDLNSQTDKEFFDKKLIEQGYSDIITQFKDIRDVDNPNSKFNQDLHTLEEKYLKKGAEFTATGNKKFLTTSSYLLACLTFNEDVINIKKSLELNKIVLQDGYTIYPNNITTETKKILKVESNSLFSFATKYKEVTLESLGSVSEFLSENVLLFIFRFRADIDPLLLKIKTILLLMFVPATGILLMLTKTTKKIGKIGDFDDAGEKLIMALLLLVFFFFTGEGHKVKNQYGEEKSLHLNTFQNLSTTLLFANMMDIANEGSNIFSKNYINFKRTSAGFNTDEEVQAIIKENLELHTIREALIGTPKGGGGNLMQECQNMYNTAKIQDRFNLQNVSFPGRIQFNEYLGNTSATSISQFYNNGFNEETNIPYLSIPLCNQFERELREVNKQIDINITKLNITKEALSKNEEQEQLLKIAEVQYKSSAELGVIGIPQVAVTNIVTDNLGLFNTNRNNEELLNYVKEENKKSNLDDSVLFNWVFENLAYMVIPGASTIQDVSSSSIGTFIKTAFKGFGFVLRGIVNQSSEIAGTVIAIHTMKVIIEYFPVVALSMASLMVITWYFISVFIYSLASPFMIVHAISTQQTESIKSYITKGIALAFKPMLILISIVIAILAVYLINDLSIMMFEGNFSLLVDIIKSKANTDYITFSDYIIIFLKGLVMVGSSIIGVLSAFYLVFNGAEILLGFIGIREIGIDVKEAVGNSVESKTSKFNTPGV